MNVLPEPTEVATLIRELTASWIECVRDGDLLAVDTPFVLQDGHLFRDRLRRSATGLPGDQLDHLAIVFEGDAIERVEAALREVVDVLVDWTPPKNGSTRSGDFSCGRPCSSTNRHAAKWTGEDAAPELVPGGVARAFLPFGSHRERLSVALRHRAPHRLGSSMIGRRRSDNKYFGPNDTRRNTMIVTGYKRRDRRRCEYNARHLTVRSDGARSVRP